MQRGHFVRRVLPLNDDGGFWIRGTGLLTPVDWNRTTDLHVTGDASFVAGFHDLFDFNFVGHFSLFRHPTFQIASSGKMT